MNVAPMISEIDAEIARLQEARGIIASIMPGTAKRGPGRPKQGVSISAAAAPAKKRSSMSPEGRARIATAMKKRWAAKRKEAKAVTH